MTSSLILRRRELLVAALSLPALAIAQGTAPWPSQPVKLIVGFPGGSTPDVVARVLADVMAPAFGQPVVVENRPGAAGNIAADQVARATDDHTLGLLINGNLTTARMLNPKLAFDPARDFSPISLIATAPLVLVGPAGGPGPSEFFAAARKAGDRWSYGSVGIGSVGHLGMELLQSRAGFAAVHVPYNGNPAVLAALMSGQIQAALIPPGLALPQARAGKIKAIGVTGARSPLAPDVPLLSALGVRVDELEVWVALVGPAGLGTAARDRLAREVPALVREPQVSKRLFDVGWQAQGSSAEALRQRVAHETEVMGKIIRERGIKVE